MEPWLLLPYGISRRCGFVGRPYERPASIPVLDIPEGFLAYGTADPLTDVTAQMHLIQLSGGPNIY